MWATTAAYKAVQYWEVENLREKGVEEIREIYAAKGFNSKLFEQVVPVITAIKPTTCQRSAPILISSSTYLPQVPTWGSYTVKR